MVPFREHLGQCSGRRVFVISVWFKEAVWSKMRALDDTGLPGRVARGLIVNRIGRQSEDTRCELHGKRKVRLCVCQRLWRPKGRERTRSNAVHGDS